MTRLKTALLACAGVAIVGAPVIAGQTPAHGLRGLFQSGAHHGAYVAPNAYETSSWQQRRLQAQLRGPGTYAVHSGQYVVETVPVVETAYALRGLQGSYQTDGVYYDRSAANAFHADRSYHLGGPVRTSVRHSDIMLDWQEHTTGRALDLLANRANGVLADNSLYVGGAIQGALMYQKTSEDGQFPLLSRFPFFSNRTDDEAAVFAINNAALSFTSTFGDWTTVYLQPEYSETEYAGEQDEFQLRKAYVVFGNLERSPFYAAFGRKTIEFGNFDSYNAFTQNEGQHYFWAVSDQPVGELGFYRDGWKFVGSAFSGGRQLRVALAGEENNIANYAFSAEKEFLLPWTPLWGDRAAFTVGGGYLHDTIYRDNWTAHTFAGRSNGTPPANFIQYRNSAVNGFAEFNSPAFDAMVEYTTTLEPWAAAIPQTVDGVPFTQFLVDPLGSTTDRDDINFDEKLSTLVAQVRWKPVVGGKRMAIAASGSWGNISDGTGNVGTFGQPTSFEDNQQHAFSVEYPISDFLDVGAEYVYNKGFIPFVAPQQVSNDETEAHAINIGFKARF